jgi:hypothetical protein
VYILAAALDDVSTWRSDAVLKEDFVVARIKDALASNPFPETSASLEIVAALRACTSLGLLARSQVDGHKKAYGYQLRPHVGEALATARLALDLARLNI